MAEHDHAQHDAVSRTVRMTRRAASGDEAAFGELYERHFVRTVRITAARVGRLLEDCQHEVEDAVQQAFADVFLRIRDGSVPDLESDGSFRWYVATAAAHVVVSTRRARDAIKRGGGKERRFADFVTTDDESLSLYVDADVTTASAIARGRELEVRLERALLSLPDPYRSAIELHCYAGMGYEEIAAAGLLQGGAGGVVKTREAVKLIVHRARRKLARAAGGDWA